MNHTYSAAGLAMTKSFESCVLKAYPDATGIPTIGYGHTGPDVHLGMTITEEEADACLQSDMQHAVDYVNELFSSVTLTQGQFDALTDFAYNCGCGALARSSLCTAIHDGNMTAAAARFSLWVYAGGRVEPGLVRRRQAEAAMFKGAA